MEPLVARLVAAVGDLVGEHQRVLVGIDGPDAAGKTTLANRLAAAIQPRALRASIDGFHNPSRLRRQRGDLSPEGYYRDSFDYASLTRVLLGPFSAGEARVTTRWYDYRKDAPAQPDVTEVPARAALVFDGVFLLREEVRHFWTLAVYLAVPPQETVRRALVRDAESLGSGAEIERRYARRYLPGQALYREESSPESFAHVVVDNVDPLNPTVIRWSTPTSQ